MFLRLVFLCFAASHFAATALQLGNVAPRPAMAWNTWNRFKCNVSEVLIKSAADQLVALQLDKLGYTSVNLDDCWQSTERDALGKLQADATRFPSGLASLGDYLHAKGLGFGIYSSAGFFTCAAGGTFPASLGMEEGDSAQFSNWGVDYLKYDNCMEDKGRPDTRYPPMAQALQASGRDVYYSICEWGRENPAAWAASIGASSWRVSSDISDNWESIISRAAINAPLWRYAGGAYLGGWNDPDMLELGNGGCSFDEYKTHFSLWAAMKSPLILGMDLSAVTLDSAMYSLISNKDVIAVNQDSAGLQARRVWSDAAGADAGAGHVIAAKCASQTKPWALQDAVEDQAWALRADGRIQSQSTGLCLQEVKSAADVSYADEQQLTQALAAGSMDLLRMDLHVEVKGEGVSDSVARGLVGRAVRPVDCSAGTPFSFFGGIGGSLISKDSGLCLEVNTMNEHALWQGKRIQTSACDDVHKKGSGTATVGRDSKEHQSWVLEHRTASGVGQLKNLYQRQCLTVDRDAPSGKSLEIWQGQLSGGAYVVLAMNLSPRTQRDVRVTPDMLQLPAALVAGLNARDLWSKAAVGVNADGSFILGSIAAHGVAMIRLSPQ